MHTVLGVRGGLYSSLVRLWQESSFVSGKAVLGASPPNPLAVAARHGRLRTDYCNDCRVDA